MADIKSIESPPVSAEAPALAPVKRSGYSIFKDHVVATISEFCGTYMFLLSAFVIAQAANERYTPTVAEKDSNPAAITMIAFGFGFSVMPMVFATYPVSGGNLNPAVTLTLFLVGAIPFTRCCFMWVAQIVAGLAAAGTASALTPGPVLFANAKGGGANIGQALFIEVFGTVMLCMTVVMCAVPKRQFTYMAPLAIGVALFVAHLFSVYYSGAGLNPARSLGPAVALRDFPGYHWIYWVGPMLGALLSAGLYDLLVLLGWDTTNPGQDASGFKMVRDPEYGDKFTLPKLR